MPDPQENLAAVTADLATANAKTAELQAALSTAHLKLTAARASATAKQVQSCKRRLWCTHHGTIPSWISGMCIGRSAAVTAVQS